MKKQGKTMEKIKPYARLLTMLGDQLIKDEKIALIELIKNSYDADAEWVNIKFENFGENYEVKDNSKLIIEDSGKGMTEDIILNHWLNPATPQKQLAKLTKKTTEKGRIIQGEKGIGRFAIFKLGSTVDIITRPRNESREFVIRYDFSGYGLNFIGKDDKPLFLEDLNVSVESRIPEIIFKGNSVNEDKTLVRNSWNNHGTRIEISNLKGAWSEKKVEGIYKDIRKLEPILLRISQEDKEELHPEFQVDIYKDGILKRYEDRYITELGELFTSKAVFQIREGRFDAEKKSYSFLLNDKKRTIALDSPKIQGLSLYKSELEGRDSIDCGSFHFSFFIFDFNERDRESLNYLQKTEKELIKEHRIYLYRDNVRVYPYGDPSDDWLKTDMYRGTKRASDFLSNDQVVGFVQITQEENPSLQDKTNREGLLENGAATSDFISLIQLFLHYIRREDYQQYVALKERVMKEKKIKLNPTEVIFDKLEKAAQNHPDVEELVVEARRVYANEKAYFERRTEITEELAGVGLSVETASHDLMAMMGKVLINLDGILKELMSSEVDQINKTKLIEELTSIRGGIGFIEAQIRDIQRLFRSSTQRRKNIRVEDYVDKIFKIYKRLLDKNEVSVEIQKRGVSPLIAKTTDAVLLQVLINLFDNSAYWLKTEDGHKRKIVILMDSDNGQLIFSDNGPGIDERDQPYIFEAFYSGKGEAGRGLGLYIARQLLARQDYYIGLAKDKKEKLLSGANFVINFTQQGGSENDD